MAGIKIPEDIQGKSFVQNVYNGKTPSNWRKSMYYHYYEYPQPHKVSPHFGVRTMQYKLIRFYGPFHAWELFDLKSDPQEMNNLYGKPGYEKITDELKTELLRLTKEYKDEEAEKIVMSYKL